MKQYNKPDIEVLLFDEEEVLTDSSTRSRGYDAAKAITKMIGDDAGLDENGNTSVSITSVKVTDLITLD